MHVVPSLHPMPLHSRACAQCLPISSGIYHGNDGAITLHRRLVRGISQRQDVSIFGLQTAVHVQTDLLHFVQDRNIDACR